MLWHNLGCILNNSGKYEIAKKCFEYLTRINPESSEGYCGESISCVKLNEMETGLICAQSAIKYASKGHPDISLYNHLAALCNKALGNTDEVRKYYDRFKAATTGVKPKEIKNCIFGFLLSSLIEKKEPLNSSLTSYESLYIKLRPQFCILKNQKTGLSKYCNPDGQWISVKTSKVLTILRSLSFFHRFKDAQLLKIISYSKFRSLPGDQILLLNKEEVIIILGGKATIYAYNKNLSTRDVIAQCGNCH